MPGTTRGFENSGSAKFSNNASVQPKFAPPVSQFELLATELVLKITRYLSLSSALSLSYTCRRFRQTVEASVKDLDYLIDIQNFLRDPKESEGERRVILERLAFLCMLERDGRLSASRAVCRGCITTHSISLFSSTALQQRPHQRLCMGLEGRLWLCPHRIWNHAQLREVQKQGWKQCECRSGEVWHSLPSTDSPSTEEYSLCIFYHVLYMPRGFEFRTASTRKGLTALGVNICPHLRFGDPKVLGAVHPGCPRLKNPRSSRKCARCASRGPRCKFGVEVNCESCKTSTAFYISKSHDETTSLRAKVSRRIAKSAGTVTDPAWIAYLYMPADFERLQEEWQASSMSRSLHN